MKPDSAGHQRIRIDLSDRDMQEFNKKWDLQSQVSLFCYWIPACLCHLNRFWFTDVLQSQVSLSFIEFLHVSVTHWCPVEPGLVVLLLNSCMSLSLKSILIHWCPAESGLFVFYWIPACLCHLNRFWFTDVL
jgi:hypothetical protein